MIKPALAELIGTFTLVFIGAGTGALAAKSGAGLVAVAWAHGLALLVIVYVWGSISGAHVNPAVTFGVAVAGRMEWPKAIVYWVVQFAGAAAAAFLLKWLLDGVAETDLGATIGTLTPHGANPGDAIKVIVLEAVLTFFLVVAVMVSGIHGRNGNLAGVAIGLVLAMDILAGGWLTGASMNPARTFGPALAANDFSYLWMYIVGPLAGGAVAGLLMEQFFLAPDRGPQAEKPDARDKRRR
jgi:MIP family channel proteins